MTMTQHIADLLYRHECVIVPQLGAFLTHRVPAQYFANNHSLYPPKKALTFNGQLQQNDGLLIQHVASTNNVSYEIAADQVAQFVNEVQVELQTNGHVLLPKIGRIAWDNEQHLLFTPLYVVNYLTESFGLPQYDTSPIDRTSVLKMEPVALTPVKEQEGIHTSLSKEDKKKAIGGWYKYAAVGALLIGLGASYISYQNYQEDRELLVQEQTSQQLTQKIQEANFLIKDPLPLISVEVAAPAKRFHIVAGAFRNPSNASKKIKQLHRKGFTSAKNLGANTYGLYTVSYDSYRSKEEALKALSQLKSNGHDSAWLWIEKE